MTVSLKRLTEISLISSIPILLIDAYFTNQFYVEAVWGFVILYVCLFILIYRNIHLSKWMIILICLGMFALSIFNFGWLFVIWIGYGFTGHNIHIIWYFAILFNSLMFVYASKKMILGEFDRL